MLAQNLSQKGLIPLSNHQTIEDSVSGDKVVLKAMPTLIGRWFNSIIFCQSRMTKCGISTGFQPETKVRFLLPAPNLLISYNGITLVL